MTPASSTTSYCTGAEAVKFFDVTFLGQLLVDDGTVVAPADVAADPNLAAELNAASGEVEASILCGGRYRPADLMLLRTPPTVGGTYLAKIVATIAIWNLMERRDPMVHMPDRVARCLEAMERLRGGENIFDFDEVQAAGNAETVRFDGTWDTRQRQVTFQARRLFGTDRCWNWDW